MKTQIEDHLQPCGKELVRHHLQLNLVQQFDGSIVLSLYVLRFPHLHITQKRIKIKTQVNMEKMKGTHSHYITYK
jgi:hypothetical protein